MREIRVSVPVSEYEDVTDVLDAHEIHYELHEDVTTPEDGSIVSILCYVPVSSTQYVLDRIRAAVEDPESLLIVLAETKSVLGEEHTDQRIKGKADKNRIARDELLERAREMQPGLRPYLTLNVLAVSIAVFGLLLDSTAVVTGAVVLASIMGPALAAGVGTVVDDQALFRRGIYMQSVGVVAVLAGGTAFAFVVRLFTPLSAGQLLGIGEISQNVAPNVLALGLAFGSGVAGAYSLSFESPSALIGVAMAAAITPPLGVTSIGIAWGLPTVAFGAFVLAILNILVINMISIPVFWARGYGPGTMVSPGTDWMRETWFQRIVVMTVLILVVASFVGYVTLGEWQNAQTEQDIRESIEEVHSEPQYQALEIVGIDVRKDQSLPVSNLNQVVVTVAYTPQIDEAIANDFLIRVSALVEHRYDIEVILSEQRAITD